MLPAALATCAVRRTDLFLPTLTSTAHTVPQDNPALHRSTRALPSGTGLWKASVRDMPANGSSVARPEQAAPADVPGKIRTREFEPVR